MDGAVGLNVGNIVGVAVGARVLDVGLAVVGTSVTSIVGVLVGSKVGVKVGAMVGTGEVHDGTVKTPVVSQVAAADVAPLLPTPTVKPALQVTVTESPVTPVIDPVVDLSEYATSVAVQGFGTWTEVPSQV
jgi:phage tail tape-measure protein